MGGKHAMARDNEGDGIFSQGLSNGAGCGRLAQGVCKLGIGDSLSHRDITSGFANLSDKRPHSVQVNQNVTKVLMTTLEMLAHFIKDINDL